MTMPDELPPETPEIADGIEFFQFQQDGYRDQQCARCGGSVEWLACANCEDGYSHHDCGEDCCCCVNPEPNVCCDWCRGTAGAWHCAETPAWCEGHPLPGREHITSTALRAEVWNDA